MTESEVLQAQAEALAATRQALMKRVETLDVNPDEGCLQVTSALIEICKEERNIAAQISYTNQN